MSKCCEEEETLFDEGLLDQICRGRDWSQTTLPDSITLTTPGEGLRLRPLKRNDNERGFLSVLGQLTVVEEDMPAKRFQETFDKMKATPDTYYVVVIEDLSTNLVIASATLQIEQKFTHGCSKRGAIEDVVVSEQYRGKQLGKVVMNALIALAKHLKCYKITLYCRDQVVPFYGSIGLQKDPNYPNCMSLRLEEKVTSI